MKKEKRNSLLAAALLFVLIFGNFCSPILAYEASPTGSKNSLGAGNNNLFLPLIINKLEGCENIIGDWSIYTDRGDTHSLTFYSNSTFKMILQGEPGVYFGSYSCSNDQFEGIVADATGSLAFKGTMSGNNMNGTWEIRENGIIDKSGQFTGQKL
jgi:hypothetical protein